LQVAFETHRASVSRLRQALGALRGNMASGGIEMDATQLGTYSIKVPSNAAMLTVNVDHNDSRMFVRYRFGDRAFEYKTDEWERWTIICAAAPRQSAAANETLRQILGTVFQEGDALESSLIRISIQQTHAESEHRRRLDICKATLASTRAALDRMNAEHHVWDARMPEPETNPAPETTPYEERLTAMLNQLVELRSTNATLTLTLEAERKVNAAMHADLNATRVVLGCIPAESAERKASVIVHHARHLAQLLRSDDLQSESKMLCGLVDPEP
jgi:hypothetical protein